MKIPRFLRRESRRHGQDASAAKAERVNLGRQHQNSARSTKPVNATDTTPSAPSVPVGPQADRRAPSAQGGRQSATGTFMSVILQKH